MDIIKYYVEQFNNDDEEFIKNHIDNALVPEDWDYFCLTGVKILGKEYDIVYDKNGTKYGKSKGLTIIEH